MAVHRRVGGRAAHRVAVRHRDGNVAPRVEDHRHIRAYRLARIRLELGAPLGEHGEARRVAGRQERRLAQRHRGVVVDRVRGGVGLQEAAHVLLEVRVGRNTYADFRELSRDVERARAPQEVVGRPPALHAEAVE